MHRNRAGLSIVETIVALMILATIGGALMALNVQIQSASNSSKFKSLAEGMAQELLEQARFAKNTAGGVSSFGNLCYTDGSLTTAGANCVTTYFDPNGNKFQQYVQVSQTGSGGMRVQAVVKWKEKGRVNFTEMDTYLYDY